MKGVQGASKWGRRARQGLVAVAAAAVIVASLFMATLPSRRAAAGSMMFSNIAPLGLTDAGAISRGACWGDYDGDGDQDLFVASTAHPDDRVDADTQGQQSRGIWRFRSHLWRNDGSAGFTDVFDQAGLRGAEKASACAFLDIDHDGDKDLFTSANNRGKPRSQNRLFRNNGDGTFTDMTAQAGVGMAEVGADGFDWADVDRDGDYDGFVAARWSSKNRFNAFFEATGPFAFKNVAAEKGLADPIGPQNTFMGNWFDYDNDGDNDLLLAIDFWGLELFRNDGGKFIRVTTTALPPAEDRTPGAPPNNPMGITWGDYDNDGCMDVFITGTNFPGQGGFTGDALGDLASRLYRNNCNGTFTDATTAAGLRPTGVIEWSANLIDYDNDGDLDLSVVAANAGRAISSETSLTQQILVLVISPPRRLLPYRLIAWAYRYEAMIPASGGTGYAAAMPNYLYQNQLVERGVARFTRVTSKTGVANMGATQGSAWADMDNDGDLDWFTPGKGTPSRLYRNNGPVGNHLRVHLVGTVLRDAVGAWIRIKTGTRSQLRHVHVLDGYLSQSQMDPHFGLGTAGLVDELWVRWPGTTTWTLMCTKVPANETVTVTQSGRCSW